MKNVLFAICLLLSTGLLFSQGITITAEAPESLIKGDVFLVRYVVAGGGEVNVDLPKQFNGFKLEAGPATSKGKTALLINGKLTYIEQVTYTYNLRAVLEGEFVLPAVSARTKGQMIVSNARTIRVTSSEKPTKAASTQKKQEKKPEAKTQKQEVKKEEKKDAEKNSPSVPAEVQPKSAPAVASPAPSTSVPEVKKNEASAPQTKKADEPKKQSSEMSKKGGVVKKKKKK